MGIETFCRSPCNTNSKSIQCSVKQHVENAILELENAIGIIEQTDKEIELDETRIENLSPKIGHEFLLDQLKYLIVPKHRRRYSITTQVFALKVHGISPACFRLIQFSNCLNLPHGRNLLKIKNSIDLESEYLSVLLKEFSLTFKDLERHVILQVGECEL